MIRLASYLSNVTLSWSEFGLILTLQCDLVWLVVTWCDLAWLGVTCCDLVWLGVTWRDLAWLGVTWRDLVWLGVTWYDLVWLRLMQHDLCQTVTKLGMTPNVLATLGNQATATLSTSTFWQKIHSLNWIKIKEVVCLKLINLNLKYQLFNFDFPFESLKGHQI